MKVYNDQIEQLVIALLNEIEAMVED